VRNANCGKLGGEKAVNVLKVVLSVHPMQALEIWEHVLGEPGADARENGREIGEIRIGKEMFHELGVDDDALPIGCP
jgi:hypothetical protein